MVDLSFYFFIFFTNIFNDFLCYFSPFQILWLKVTVSAANSTRWRINSPTRNTCCTYGRSGCTLPMPHVITGHAAVPGSAQSSSEQQTGAAAAVNQTERILCPEEVLARDGVVEVPTIFQQLPHLLERPDALVPRVLIGKKRDRGKETLLCPCFSRNPTLRHYCTQKFVIFSSSLSFLSVSLVIGVPTVMTLVRGCNIFRASLCLVRIVHSRLLFIIQLLLFCGYFFITLLRMINLSFSSRWRKLGWFFRYFLTKNSRFFFNFLFILRGRGIFSLFFLLISSLGSINHLLSL